ncbi:hypothetical protein EYF80_044075 [Liparis tanakae]|uniref:Uncharacterized protein n=1 Tax=Liparis tanakae TaxID=230148 RepID=A0A4Z2FYT8_9TELE|nr:hypothetical protein EYF80_044075 [Liparis tanakae]
MRNSRAPPYHTSLTAAPPHPPTPDLDYIHELRRSAGRDVSLLAGVTTSLPPRPAAPLPTWGRGGGGGGRLTHSIIRSHCSAPPFRCPIPPPPTPLANGTNLYSLSALMSSHAEKRPYHIASGSHHLSPSPNCLPSLEC